LAVTKIITVDKLSRHLTPLYLDESFDVFNSASEEPDDEEKEDMLNGHEPPSAHEQSQPEVGSEEFVYQSQLELLKSQASPAKEMQDVCKALNELIGWRLMEDIVTKEA
jgi:hypothetical protein